MKWVLVFLILVSVVAASNAVKCPHNVGVGKEFECTLNWEKGWDVKLDLRDGKKNIARVWDPTKEKWVSGFYYLKDFSGEEKLRAKIGFAGEWKGRIIFRKGSKKKFFDIGFEVGEEGKKKEKQEKQEARKEVGRVVLGKNVSLGRVVLGKNVEKELVFESKNSKAVGYSLYFFIAFVIVVAGIIVWRR